MILRRFAEALKQQNWAAIAIEFVLLVAGVFLGIQVANWNGDRVERLQEQGLLIRLHDNFLESVSGQDRDIRFLERQLADQAILLKSLDACDVAAADHEAFQRGINTLGYINPPRFVRSAVNEMVAGGKADIIRNADIKAELAAIVALADWRAQGFDQSARTTEQYRYIVEGRVRFAPARKYPDEFLGDFMGVDYDIKALCANPNVASAVSAISNTTYERRNAYVPLLKRYRDFLPKVEAELQSRWQVQLTGTAEP
jgi:hypothetical protein